MTIQKWLLQSMRQLQSTSVSTARLDAELLLADLLGKDRSWVLAHPEFELSSEQSTLLDRQVSRRTQHEPIAYILGKQEFYGREFIVTPDTLTPRPETETLVELALEVLRHNEIKSVADLGTGSGCITISLELEADSKASFTGYEISKSALEIAQENAKRLKSKVAFVEADIAKGAGGNWQNAEMIVANLPYVTEDYEINQAAKHEPSLALFAREKGLEFYRIMFEKATDSNTFALTESLEFQHKELENIALKNGYKLQRTQDLIQVFERVQELC